MELPDAESNMNDSATVLGAREWMRWSLSRRRGGMHALVSRYQERGSGYPSQPRLGTAAAAGDGLDGGGVGIVLGAVQEGEKPSFRECLIKLA